MIGYGMHNDTPFNRYSVRYSEGASVDRLVQSFIERFSGFENYEFYEGRAETEITFTKGVYSFWIRLSGSPFASQAYIRII